MILQYIKETVMKLNLENVPNKYSSVCENIANIKLRERDKAIK